MTDSAPPPRHRRQLRNLLLDRRYQLRFTLFIVALSAALTGGLGALVWLTTREATSVMHVRAMLPGDPSAAALERELAHNDHLLAMALVGFGVVLAIALALYGIVLTHKVAGPLHKIAAQMRLIGDGKLGDVGGDLRRGDQLHDFYEVFRGMHEALIARARADVAALDAALAALDESHPATERLRALRREKSEALEDT